MNARELTAAIARYTYYETRSQVVVPNYTPKGWWECDVFVVTASGYMREYEIKTSRADFKSDFKKARSQCFVGMDYVNGKSRARYAPGEQKHDMLAAGDPTGPKQFWFVTPEGLLDASEIPDHAGLIEIGTWQGKPYWNGGEVRPAPVLHKSPVLDSYVKGAFTSAYHRCVRQMIG